MTGPAYGEGVVYFALDATNTEQRVKIGYTSDLLTRLKALGGQTCYGQAPLLLALEAGGREREQQLHDRFRTHRLYGEWFRYGADVQEYVEGLPAPISWVPATMQVWQYVRGLKFTVPEHTWRTSEDDEGIREPGVDVVF